MESEGACVDDVVLGGGEEEDVPEVASLVAEAEPYSLLINAWLVAHATTASL